MYQSKNWIEKKYWGLNKDYAQHGIKLIIYFCVRLNGNCLFSNGFS